MLDANFLRARGCRNVAIASAAGATAEAWQADGVLAPDQTGDYDGVLVVDSFNLLMRRLESMQRRGAIIAPANPDDVVSANIRNADAMATAWNFSPAANYVARCGLKGNYLEFGVFWGRSFFRNHFLLRPWLDGSFFAFDSFCGLSTPKNEEIQFTAGDFQEGAYACNQASFEAIGDAVSADMNRVQTIPGFFDQTLRGKRGASYGIEDRSVAVCVVDCDIFEPTLDVLNFITPLLADGALLYFDDWRLCRASPHVGERAAALRWLSAHPEFELIDFPGDAPMEVSSWQHAWFIFQRRPRKQLRWRSGLL